MKKTGWDCEKAFREMARVREETGITYAEYDRNDIFKYSGEEQKEKAEEVLRNRKKWNRSVEQIMEETGHDRDIVIEELDQVRRINFITAKQFVEEKLYETSDEEYERLCRKLRARNTRNARREYIKRAIRVSKMQGQHETAETEERDTSSLKYKGVSREKQPDPVIAACYYLGIPLPEDADGDYQPSAFVPEIKGGLKEIRNAIGRKKVPDTEYVNREFKLFKKKFESMSTLKYNETDLMIFFTDYVIHCMDQGYRAIDYFNYDFYKNDPDVRCTFISTGKYKRYVRRLCIKDIDLFKNKGNFN